MGEKYLVEWVVDGNMAHPRYSGKEEVGAGGSEEAKDLVISKVARNMQFNRSEVRIVSVTLLTRR